MQKFYKGRTNNHLTWVMVDATDFATPESALSAAMKIKIYGKLRSAAGVNFVSSGTGSLTNDITHVGASATGIYSIGLAKADLSDASAAWYDQYIISLSATGAAYQALVVDGGIDDSYVSNAISYLSNIVSYLSNFASNVSGVVSDIRSGTSDTNSKLVVMSGILSDSYSMLVAHSNMLSNASNYLSYISGVVSGLGAGQSASAIADKVWSDFGSKVGRSVSDVMSELIALSDAVSNVQSTLDSQFVVVSNYLSNLSAFASDTYSGVSELQSRVTAAVATASDVASKVWAEKYTAASNVKASTFGSALRLNMSRISDVQSYLVVMSGMLSDTYSAANATGATASAIADKVWSDYQSKVGVSPSQAYSHISNMLSNISGLVSDVDSALTSQFNATSNTLSQILADTGTDGVLLAADAIGAAQIAANAIGAAELAQDAAQEVADEVLNRNLAGSGSGNTRNVRNALRVLRNKRAVAANELQVYQEDDLTVAWSATTSTAAGNPLVSVDPD